MRLILIVLISFLSISSVSSSSIINPISDLFYTYLNPIFQSTLERLTRLVFELTEKLSQHIQYNSARINPPITAPWVSQVFGGMNSVATQWNNQIADFFSNIPTIIEQKSRSAVNYAIVKETLYKAVENLLGTLKSLFVNNINRLMLSIVNDLKLSNTIGLQYTQQNFDDLLNIFQRQVSDIFDETQTQLNITIDNAIQFIVTYWNHLKQRIFS